MGEAAGRRLQALRRQATAGRIPQGGSEGRQRLTIHSDAEGVQQLLRVGERRL